MSIKGWMDKQIMIYWYNGILFSNFLKKGLIVIDKMNEFWNNHVSCKLSKNCTCYITYLYKIQENKN